MKAQVQTQSQVNTFPHLGDTVKDQDCLNIKKMPLTPHRCCLFNAWLAEIMQKNLKLFIALLLLCIHFVMPAF